MISRQVIRKFMTSAARRSDHGPDGVPGANLPFDITNKYKVTGTFILFFGSGFFLPFYMSLEFLKRM